MIGEEQPAAGPGDGDGNLVVEVAVPIPLRQPLTYAVPPAFAALARPGARARVPVGKRRLTGIILGRPEEVPADLDLKALEAVVDLTARIHQDFTYDPHATTIQTPIEDVFRQRHGVCQDFAHLEIGMLRSLGMAARYVSGYLRTSPPPGKPRLVGADACTSETAFHPSPSMTSTLRRFVMTGTSSTWRSVSSAQFGRVWT